MGSLEGGSLGTPTADLCWLGSIALVLLLQGLLMVMKRGSWLLAQTALMGAWPRHWILQGVHMDSLYTLYVSLFMQKQIAISYKILHFLTGSPCQYKGLGPDRGYGEDIGVPKGHRSPL